MLKWKNKSAQQSADQALEQRVDAMMNPNVPDPVPVTKESKANEGTIDIFSDRSLKSKVSSSWLDEVSAKTEASEAPTAEATKEPPKSAELDDIATDRAVEAIEAEETTGSADTTDKRFDFTAPKRPVAKKSRFGFIKSKRFYIPVLVLLIALFVVPFTRYPILGLVLKKPVSVVVLDRKTSVPVSGALVSVGGGQGKTDNAGKATVQSRLGSHEVSVSKQYFISGSSQVFVGFKSPKPVTVKMTATGRQIPIKVINAVTGHPVANAKVTVANTDAQTGSDGKATIVLPASATSEKASVSANGYDDLDVNIDVTSDLQTFKLVPSGYVYFLSDKNGTIDVVKTRLDGSNRTTVLQGTGKEDAATTSLIASRDWQFLVLKAKRDSDQPALYVIDTSTDKATQFESANANISLIGWYGHNVLYDVVKTSGSPSQSGREVIKSYNADSQQLNLLDQTAAEGTSDSYGSQSFADFHLVDNALIYTVLWNATGGYDISSKDVTVRSIQTNGQNKKDLQTFPEQGFTSLKSVQHAPGAIYYALLTAANPQSTFYEYANGSFGTNTNLDQPTFDKAYPTYLFSPSGAQTFWDDIAGANYLFVGDNTGSHQHQIGNLNGYTPFGWYGENYILVTRAGEALYIFSPTDSNSVRQPLRISDFYHATTTYPGYEYGYGGL